MPDNERNEQIERAIDREVAGGLTVRQHGASTFTVAPRSMAEILEFAKLMSISGICIRPIFRGNPGSCLAIVLQAMKWGADPFAVANKAFEVNGQLSYEAQLIHAIVNASPVLAERLHASYTGEGPQRQCLVVGMIKGEDEGREYLSPKIGDITPKNSPLWKTDPDQQLFYYSTRAWARRWVPEILLGIYAPDELTIEHEPPPPRPTRAQFADERQQRIEALADEGPAESAASPPDRKEEPQHPHTQAGSPQDMQQHSGARQDRPQAGTPIPAGGATPPQEPPQRRRRRTKAEMEAARAAADADADTYAVIDPDGEIHEFDTASQAVELLTNLFTAARTFSALKALHEDNQDFIFALPNETLSALREIYTTKRQSELAAEAPATTERPNGTDDAPEPDRQSPRVEEIPPTTRVQSAGAPPSNARISYAIEPVYTRTGQIDRAWWIALLIPKLRASKSKEELALRLADNGETIASYKQTLTPPALIAAMKEIDDIQREIAG